MHCQPMPWVEVLRFERLVTSAAPSPDGEMAAGTLAVPACQPETPALKSALVKKLPPAAIAPAKAAAAGMMAAAPRMVSLSCLFMVLVVLRCGSKTDESGKAYEVVCEVGHREAHLGDTETQRRSGGLGCAQHA